GAVGGGDAAAAAKVVEEAVAAFDKGDETAARALFTRALELDPRNVTAHTYMGIMSDRAGDLAAAERHFAAAAIAAPLLPSARNNHGAVLLRLGRTPEAIKQFETSLKLDRNQPSALVNLAQIRFAEGTPESLRAALDLFTRAQALEPDAGVARALVVTALKVGDRAAAAAHYRDYAARAASGAGPEGAGAAAHADLGGALLEAELYAEAARELEAATASDPSNVDAIVRLGRAYVALNDLPAAGRTLEGAVARGTEAAPVYALLASVYEKSGHIENAIPAMRLAIQRDPQREEYRFRYGMLLTNVLAPGAAVIRLEEALKSFPNSARLWFALGLAQFRWSKNDDAAKALRRAIELDEKFAPAYAYLGMTSVELGQYDEAVKLFERALAADEKLGVVHHLIADVLLKKQDADLPLVESHLVRAVRMDETFAPARLALAKVYIRTNRYTEAAAALERAVSLDPKLAEAYYHLGRAYLRLGRKAEGEATLEKFKQLSEEQKTQAQNERREIVRRLANVLF
ncbi:MAG TPA: tetratricopeptide repeat protein, partial [Pyrinomonadaceae bacterium]|nr:tetratricopeptide repeat protein [Pyrinomonadaceae bacterium]